MPASFLIISLIRSAKPPNVAKLSFPGLALACAIMSLMFWATALALVPVSTTNGCWNATASGAKSRVEFVGRRLLHQIALHDGAARDQQRMAVRRRLRHIGGTERAARARSIFHDHRLLQRVFQLRREIASQQISGRAGRERHDQIDRLAREGGAEPTRRLRRPSTNPARTRLRRLCTLPLWPPGDFVRRL